MFVVYILKDQDIPFLVGKGASKQRAYSHEKFAKSDDITDLGYGLKKDFNPRKTSKIRKMLRENHPVEYEIKEFPDERSAFDEEIRLILHYGRRGIDVNGILMNIHPGGTGGWIPLTKEQQAKANQKRSHTLANLPEDIKTARRLQCQERSRRLMQEMPEEKRIERSKKISHSRLGYQTGQPSRKRGQPATGNNKKGVRKAWNEGRICPEISNGNLKYHASVDKRLSGQVSFKLINPAGETVEGMSLEWLIQTYDLSARVRYLIRGDVPSYKGWIRFEDKGSVIPKTTMRVEKGGQPKEIDRYSLEGIFLDKWPSINAAAKSIGKTNGGTLSNMISEGKTYCGFIWKEVSCHQGSEEKE